MSFEADFIKVGLTLEFSEPPDVSLRFFDDSFLFASFEMLNDFLATLRHDLTNQTQYRALEGFQKVVAFEVEYTGRWILFVHLQHAISTRQHIASGDTLRRRINRIENEMLAHKLVHRKRLEQERHLHVVL